MHRLHSEEQGFSIMEGILLVAVILLLGIIGHFVYANHTKTTSKNVQQTTTATSKTVPSTPSASVGASTSLKSYTLLNEKSSFTYPSTWKLSVTNTHDGQDTVELTNTDGYYLDISTVNLGHPSLDSPATIIDSVPTTFLGQTGYLNYFSIQDGSSATGTAINAEISMTPSSVLDTLFATKNLQPSGYYSIGIGNKTIPITLAGIKADAHADYATTLTILASIKY